LVLATFQAVSVFLGFWLLVEHFSHNRGTQSVTIADSYLEDKAFRHGENRCPIYIVRSPTGDIEDILIHMAQAAGGGFLGRSKKFSPLDVKRTYFGNWLRDYSQAVDVGALKKVPLQTILNIVMVLGFLGEPS
jgi:hypothetical protein